MKDVITHSADCSPSASPAIRPMSPLRSTHVASCQTLRTAAGFCVIAAIAALLPTERVSAEEARLLTGKALREALQQRKSFNTIGVPLREFITDFQAHSGIALLLDRRVDPTVQPELSTKYVTTSEVLEQLAAVQSASMTATEDYVFIGPRNATSRLRTLLAIRTDEQQQLRKQLDPALLRQLSIAEDASWDRLSQPRQLLIDRAHRVGLSITNPDRIPHDLWAGATLPRLPFSNLATLILNQFDLTFEMAANGEVTIINVPAVVSIENRHRISSREKAAVEARWKNEFPDLAIDWRGTTAVVSATVETHERLEQLARNQSTETVAAAEIHSRTFTMAVPVGTTFGQLIETFRQSDVPIRIEGRSTEQLTPLLQQTTAFDLKGLSGSRFFPQIFAAWPAHVEVGDHEVLITFSD